MKTNKEVLKLMLANTHLLSDGLCGLSYNLYMKNSITEEEYTNILTYIKNNRPKSNSKLAEENRPMTSAWYWHIGEVAPRVRWLKYHIRICKS